MCSLLLAVILDDDVDILSMGLLLSRSVCLGLGRLTLVLFKYCCIYSTGYAPIFGGLGCGRSRGR